MGAVYAALDERLERAVAIKVLLEAERKGQVAVARFEREAKAMAAIRHPGIVEVYDRGQDGGLFYVVMERLEGHDLAHRILHAGAVFAKPPRRCRNRRPSAPMDSRRSAGSAGRPVRSVHD